MALNRHINVVNKIGLFTFLRVIFSSKVAENQFLLFYRGSKQLNFLVTLINGVSALRQPGTKAIGWILALNNYEFIEPYASDLN